MPTTPSSGLPEAPRLLLPRSRRSPWSLGASVVVHAALILLIVAAHWREILSWEPLPFPGPGDELLSGGGGGGGIRVVALPALQESRPRAVERQPVLETPVPTALPAPSPEVTPPDPDQEPLVPVPLPDSTGAQSLGLGGGGSGGGRGEGVGRGVGDGIGDGSGPGSGRGAGEGGRATPPVPRQLILPPLDYPGSLRGRTVAVTFWVGVDGRVERVALDPEIDDRRFAKRFSDVMMNYRFRPARSADGRLLPGTTTVRVSF